MTIKCSAQGPESSTRARASYYSSWAAALVDPGGCPACGTLPGGQGPEEVLSDTGHSPGGTVLSPGSVPEL